MFDSNLYRIALRTCALETDLQELKDGDHTKIGSKGVSLSSGQKHRIVSFLRTSSIRYYNN